MKKELLFIMLALSVSAFSQSKLQTYGFLNPALIAKENIHGKPDCKIAKMDNSFSGRNPTEIFPDQTTRNRALAQIFDSIYYWQWDLNLGWRIANRTINIVYDANHNLINYTEQVWDGSAWWTQDQHIFTYDDNHHPTSELLQRWNGVTLWNYSQYSYTFDENNNQTNILYQLWNGSTWGNSWQNILSYNAYNNLVSNISQTWSANAWVNESQMINTWDANNNLTNFLTQTWNGAAWVNSGQIINTYDTNNNLVKKLIQMWINSSWENSEQYTLIYDANGNLESELLQKWNTNTWDPYSQYFYVYDAANNLIHGLWQHWDGSAWIDIEQDILTYDAHNNLTNNLSLRLNGDSWVNDKQDLFTYDDNNFKKSESIKEWESTGTTIYFGDSTYYFFHTAYNGINEAKDDGITVYPNPCAGRFTVSAGNTVSSIEIYNLLGDRIYIDTRPNKQTSLEIDVSNFPKGIYFVKVIAGTKLYTTKIIIE